MKGEPPRGHGEVVPASDVRDVRSHGEVVPASEVQDARGRLGRHEEPVSPDLLTASFPIAMRGYRREAVDSHIERLNRVIAELEMNRSPRSAVRAALDWVGEQTAGILRQARRAAEEIVTQAREEADEITGRATAEARELIVDVSDDADRVRAEAAEQVRSATQEADALLAAARQEAERVAARAQADADELHRQLSEELEARRAEAETKMLELRADTDSVREERYELLAEIASSQTRRRLSPAKRSSGCPMEPRTGNSPRPTGHRRRAGRRCARRRGRRGRRRLMRSIWTEI